jgi:hypothetical protein
MRIPPSVAREIGQQYATARVHEHAARQLDASTTLMQRAGSSVGAGDFDGAAADAARAVDLLTAVARDSRQLEASVATAAATTFVQLSLALTAVSQQQGAAAIEAFTGGAQAAIDGARLATDVAASARAAADDLARPYL